MPISKKSISIPEEFYYITTVRGMAFTAESSGDWNDADLDRMVNGFSDYWRCDQKKEQKKRHLILSDWRLRFQPKEKIAHLQRILEDLRSKDFSLYIEQHGAIHPVFKKDLLELNTSVCHAMEPCHPDELVKKALDQHRLSRDQVFILDDYWVDKLCQDELVNHGRCIQFSHYQQLDEQKKATLVKIYRDHTCKTGKISIILSEFEKSTIDELKTLTQQLERQCEIITQYLQVNFDKDDVASFIKSSNIYYHETLVTPQDLQATEAIHFQSDSDYYLTTPQLIKICSHIPHLKELYAYCLKPSNEHLSLTHNLLHLHTLGLSGPGTNIALPSLVAAAPNLKTMILNQFNGATLENGSLQQLEEIRILNTLEDVDLRPLLKAAPHLKKLTLSNAYITSITTAVYQDLESLDLTNSKGLVWRDLVALLKRTPKLQHLHLSARHVDEFEQCNFIEIEQKDKERLRIGENKDLSSIGPGMLREYLQTYFTLPFSLYQNASYILQDNHLYYLDHNIHYDADLELVLDDFHLKHDVLFHKLNDVESADDLNKLTDSTIRAIYERTGHSRLTWTLDQLGLPHKILNIESSTQPSSSLLPQVMEHYRCYPYTSLSKHELHRLNQPITDNAPTPIRAQATIGTWKIGERDKLPKPNKPIKEGSNPDTNGASCAETDNFTETDNSTETENATPIVTSLTSMLNKDIEQDKEEIDGIDEWIKHELPNLSSQPILQQSLDQTRTLDEQRQDEWIDQQGIELTEDEMETQSEEEVEVEIGEIDERDELPNMSIPQQLLDQTIILDEQRQDERLDQQGMDLTEGKDEQFKTEPNQTDKTDEIDKKIPNFKHLLQDRLNYEPTSSSIVFRFRNQIHFNADMVIYKLNQYLLLKNHRPDLIPRIFDGICDALTQYFLDHTSNEWRSFKQDITQWNGQRTTLTPELRSHFEKLLKYKQYPLKDSCRFIGDHLELYLAQAKEAKKNCRLSNAWHCIALKPQDSGKWILYDSYDCKDDGVEIVSAEKIISAIHDALGHLIVAPISAKTWETPKVVNLNQFIEEGGLILHHQDISTIFEQLENDYSHEEVTIDVFSGLLRHSNAGIPAWYIGLVYPHKGTLTAKILQQVLDKYPDIYLSHLQKGLRYLTPLERLTCIQAFIQHVKPGVQLERLINIVRHTSNKFYWGEQLKIKLAQSAHTLSSYCQSLIHSESRNRLIELPSPLAMNGLRFKLESYAKKTNRQILYAHTSSDLARILQLYPMLHEKTPHTEVNPRFKLTHLNHVNGIWSRSIQKDIPVTPMEQRGEICKPVSIAAIDHYYAETLGFAPIPLYKRQTHPISIRQLAKQQQSLQGELLEIAQVQAIFRHIGYQTHLLDVEQDQTLFKDAIIHHLNLNNLMFICFAVDRYTGELTIHYDHTECNEHAAVITGFDIRSNTVTLAHWGNLYQVNIDILYFACNALPSQREPEYYRKIPEAHLSKKQLKYDLKMNSKSGEALRSIIPRENSGFRGKLLVIKQPQIEQVLAWGKSLQERLHAIEQSPRSTDTLEPVPTRQRPCISNIQRQDKNPSPDAPILIINYDQFSMSELVRFNTILSENRSLDGKPILNDLLVIGLRHYHNPNKYQGVDFYDHFSQQAEICPLSEDVLQHAIPQLPMRTNKKPDAIIRFYHSANWRSILLGRWNIRHNRLSYQEGELGKALAMAKRKSLALDHAPCLTLDNAPWDDPEFVLFWQTAIAQGKITDRDRSISLPTGITLMKQEGYDWEQLTSVLVTTRNDTKQPKPKILNPYLLSRFFRQYTCQAGCLTDQPGWIELAKQCKTLNIHITRQISEDEWAHLLDECRHYKIKLHVTCTPDISLPGISPNRVKIYPTNTNDKIIYSTDIDTTVAFMTANASTWRVIDVSELNPADLLEITEQKSPNQTNETLNMSQIRTTYELPFKFKQTQGAALMALSQNIPLILKGSFSEKLIDHLALLLIKRALTPAQSPLVIVTHDTKAFRYMSVSTHNIRPEDKLKYLPLLPADIRALQPFMDKPLATLMSLHRFMNRMKHADLNDNWLGMYTNPAHPYISRPFDPNTSAAEAKKYLNQRLERVMNVLETEPFVFLSGLSGVGKSTFIRKTLAKDPQITIFRGEKALLDWANRQTGMNILVLDEATLSHRSWSNVEGLYHSGIVIQSTYYPLTKGHKVIFAGNPVSYGNERQLGALFQRYGNAVYFDMLPPSVIYEDILKPLITRCSRLDPVAISPYFLGVYDFLATHSINDVLISPRQIEMMALLTLSHCKSHPNADPEVVAKYYAFHIGKPLVPKSHLQTFTKTFKPTEELKRSSYVPPSRQSIVNQIEDILALQQWRKTDKQSNISETEDTFLYGGLGSFVIEGEGNVDKIETIIHTLVRNGFEEEHSLDPNKPTTKPKPFYRLSLTHRDKEKLLRKFFNEGAIVLIEEMNSADMMEALLNDLLMGFDPETGQRPTRPGFFVMSTQSPATLPGRRIASMAQSMRSMTATCEAYSENELLEILHQKGLSLSEAAQLVAVSTQASDLLSKTDPMPTFSTLMTLADNHLKYCQHIQDTQEALRHQNLTPTHHSKVATHSFFSSKQDHQTEIEPPKHKNPNKIHK